MFHQRVFSDWIWRISKFPFWRQILDIYRLPLLTTVFTLHSSSSTESSIDFTTRSTNLLSTFSELVIPVRVNSNLWPSNPSSFTSRSWHKVISEPLSRRAYVSITLPLPLPRTLTGMIPRHPRFSNSSNSHSYSITITGPVRDPTGTSLGCNCFWGFTSLDPAFWFRFRVSLAFDSLLVPRSVVTGFRCIKVWWLPPHPECWHLKFTFGQSLAMFPFAKHLLQSPPRCTFLFSSWL